MAEEIIVNGRVTARITRGPSGSGPAAPSPPVPEEKIAYYRHIVAADFEDKYFNEERPRYFPGGFDRIKALNATLRRSVASYKEFAAARLAESEDKGSIEYCPAEANHHHLHGASNPGEDE